ncbi:hypothetical protein V0U79_05695 [Hyphobacterium sp. HN65]|uniref:Uncharacterized protein n=1 Tax=Hyphobacterium lacteum TaxID=3116575 RepID=A0ABU7LPM8_9PROT|nr:hypothetical protein [Hyphobacterium sp. HN65]MEE2525852.1 hypothetical protein [Hyphobacterium sp. HN65]
MPHALLLSSKFPKNDSRLEQMRSSLTEQGYQVISLSYDSGGEAHRDEETRDLRPRAAGLLMLLSQLIIAGVIAGYFSRFYPLAMTMIFWTTIAAAIGLTSPFGRSVRQSVFLWVSEYILWLETAKHRFQLVWAADSEMVPMAQRVAQRCGAELRTGDR